MNFLKRVGVACSGMIALSGILSSSGAYAEGEWKTQVYLGSEFRAYAEAKTEPEREEAIEQMVSPALSMSTSTGSISMNPYSSPDFHALVVQSRAVKPRDFEIRIKRCTFQFYPDETGALVPSKTLSECQWVLGNQNGGARYSILKEILEGESRMDALHVENTIIESVLPNDEVSSEVKAKSILVGIVGGSFVSLLGGAVSVAAGGTFLTGMFATVPLFTVVVMGTGTIIAQEEEGNLRNTDKIFEVLLTSIKSNHYGQGRDFVFAQLTGAQLIRGVDAFLTKTQLTTPE